MKKYLYLLYHGCYYLEWSFTKFTFNSLNPLLRWVGAKIPYLFPFIKNNLAKQGRTPEENIDYVIKFNNRIAFSNVGHQFEGIIGMHLFIFFIFFFLDLLFILRLIFGYFWWGYYIGRWNVVPIGWVIIVLATICMYAMVGLVGTDKNEKKFRRQSKKEQRKALWVYLGSFSFVLILFFLLWGHKLFGL